MDMVMVSLLLDALGFYSLLYIRSEKGIRYRIDLALLHRLFILLTLIINSESKDTVLKVSD
jgi:hypothetical protein